ncbi:MAG: D-cysteine desulfhydrase family protein [Rhodospirillales bacterium]|nr:D-cysteine desulfhydrase family protein [Rhodospirillales bacterium]
MTGLIAIPGLERFSRAAFGHLPTPIEEAPNLTAALGGPRILIKRDDCTGLGFGGNKVRQLEFYMGEARARGADTVLITGAVQSNFVRTCAAFAARLGMQCHIQLEERVAEVDELYRNSGNVLLDRLMGATLHAYPAGEDEAGADARLETIAADLARRGRRPYVIHLGPGHPPLGALGYALAAAEIAVQDREADLGIGRVVVASGSGATHAGLLYGFRALGDGRRITGICVRRPAAQQSARIAERVAEIGRLAGNPVDLAPSDVDIADNSLAPGYGKFGAEVTDAILIAARSEGLFLDPVYTGKAMAGMIRLIADGGIARNETVLFVHTGGTPAIFAYEPALRAAAAAAR